MRSFIYCAPNLLPTRCTLTSQELPLMHSCTHICLFTHSPQERRRIARDEKLAAAQGEHEARMARALERASAPVYKKMVGLASAGSCHYKLRLSALVCKKLLRSTSRDWTP